MLTLIYGTNQVAVRNFILKSAKDLGASSIREYVPDNETIASIENSLQGDLFGEKSLSVLDVSKSQKALLEKLFNLLKNYPESPVLLISNKDLELSSPLIKTVKALKGRVISAILTRPVEVFKYLGDLYSKNEASCYVSLKKLLETDNDPVYILVMLQYQLKNIALVKFGLGNKLPPFQLGPAQKQAQNFSEERILELYELLYKFDAELKTGKIIPEDVVLLATQKILTG